MHPSFSAPLPQNPTRAFFPIPRADACPTCALLYSARTVRPLRLRCTKYVKKNPRKKNSAGEATTRLYVTDKSTHGTLINGTKLAKERSHQLVAGDSITFGSANTTLEVGFWALKIAASSLDLASKANLKNVALKLGKNLQVKDFTVRISARTKMLFECCRCVSVRISLFLSLSACAHRRTRLCRTSPACALQCLAKQKKKKRMASFVCIVVHSGGILYSSALQTNAIIMVRRSRCLTIPAVQRRCAPNRKTQRTSSCPRSR